MTSEFIKKLSIVQSKFKMNYSQLGKYLGVGPHCASRWAKGVSPSESIVKLLDVLTDLEKVAPDVHEKYLPNTNFHFRKKSVIGENNVRD